MAAEWAISNVVQLLGDPVIHKMGSGEFQLLRDRLIRMQCFLRDAEKKGTKDREVRRWIWDIGEVALDAEEAIEIFIHNIGNLRKSRILLERYAWWPNHLDTIRKVIKSIFNRLDDIENWGESYGIRNLGESGWKSQVKGRRRLAPWEKDEHLVGVEDDVKKLLETIMDEEKKGLSMVAVVGRGGIGKSALAREVYNHPDIISGRFDCRAWVMASIELNDPETFKQLILETTRSELEKQDLNGEIEKLVQSTRYNSRYLVKELQELLHRRLEGKTYFIVLDELWAKEHLDSIMTALPNEKDKTSRLLLTCRSMDIAQDCQSLHAMELLDNEKSWELFLKKGLTCNSNGGFPKELEQRGKQILENCGGLPLSIILMGGLAVETWSDREYEETLYELGSRRVGEFIHIELSYWNLPSQMKCCFFCFAFFKENATIPVKRLVNIMVGLGFIQQIGRTTATTEEIARGYLDELINRNVVLVKDLTLDNRVKSCHLHNILHDLSFAKAREEIYLAIQWRLVDLHKARHYVVKYDDLGDFHMTDKRQCRSLFVINVREDTSEIKFKSAKWKSFQILKILDLNCDSPLRRLPNSFRLLIWLKQLRIHRQPNKIFFNALFNPSSSSLKLPAWLNSLKKLEVLDLGIELVEFPKVALEMDSLRYIHAYCVRGHGPIITDSWKNVETLKYIRFENWMSSSLSLMDGCQVRELGIIMADESSNVSASLQKLEHLVKLYLLWNYLLPIDAINIPHLGNLTKLKLNGMMMGCPNASVLPPTITHLTLENSFLDEDPMQELGKLPNLLYLKLKDHSYMGERMQVLHNGFPSLVGLHLREMYELRKIVIKEGGMPQLKLVQVRDCHALDTKNLLNKSYKLQILDTI